MFRRLAVAFCSGMLVCVLLDAAPAAPQLPPPPAWTGFYLGLNAGANLGGDENTRSGFSGGGQIGYNYQVYKWVYGLEADAQSVVLRRSGSFNQINPEVLGVPASPATCFITYPLIPGGGDTCAQVAVLAMLPEAQLIPLCQATPGCTVTQTAATPATPGSPGSSFSQQFSGRLDWVETIRGRIGFTVAPNVLVYGTAGFALGEAQLTYAFVSTSTTNGVPTINASTAFSSRSFLSGYAAGAGVEVMIARFWSIKAEYLFIDLGSKTWGGGSVAGVALPLAQMSFRTNIVRAGLNFHF